MQGLDRQAGSREGAAKLHQATGIDRDDGGGAGLFDGLDFGARHAAGDFGEFDREGPAETAAFLRDIHFTEFEAFDFGQKLARRILNLELAEGVATVVRSDDAVEARSDIVGFEDAGDEARELVDLGFEGVCRSKFGRVCGEDIGEMVADHRGAGTGGDHDVLRVREDLEKVAGDGAGFFVITAGMKAG